MAIIAVVLSGAITVFSVPIGVAHLPRECCGTMPWGMFGEGTFKAQMFAFMLEEDIRLHHFTAAPRIDR